MNIMMIIMMLGSEWISGRSCAGMVGVGRSCVCEPCDVGSAGGRGFGAACDCAPGDGAPRGLLPSEYGSPESLWQEEPPDTLILAPAEWEQGLGWIRTSY